MWAPDDHITFCNISVSIDEFYTKRITKAELTIVGDSVGLSDGDLK